MREVKCQKCGKIFCPAPQHIFAENKQYWCKWTCWNHRKDNEETAKGKKAKSVEATSLNGKAKMVFASAKDAAESLGFCTNGIREACRQQTPYNGYLWKYAE